MLAATPGTLVIRPLLVMPFSDWDLSLTRHALDNHEIGDFADSGLLLDAFGRDDRIGGCLDRRARALASKKGIPFCVVPSDFDTTKASDSPIATEAEAIWWDVHDEPTISRAMRDGVGAGAALGQIAWTYDKTKATKRWKPKLIPRHISNLRWDPFQSRWMYRTLDGEIEITPGDGNWFLFTPGGVLDPWMAGALRALAIPFVMRSGAWRDWARWSEKHGLPTILASVPTSAEGKEEFLKKLANLGRETFIALPKNKDGKGFEVSTLDVPEAWQGFQGLLERIDTCVAVYLFGNNLSTEVQGGSYAAATAHAYIDGTKLSGDAEALVTALREQVWKPWAAYNFGNPDLAPWGSYDTAPPEDKTKAVSVLVSLADAITKFEAAGAPLDVAELANRYGLPLKPKEDLDERGPLLEIHLKYGILTIDEARARMGLEPLPDGAGAEPYKAPAPMAPSPPTPPGEENPGDEGEPGEPADGESAPPKDAGRPKSKPPASLAASVAPAFLAKAVVSEKPVERGQQYVDAVADAARARAVRVLGGDIKALRELIAGATTLEEVRDRLASVYAGMSPEALAGLVTRAMLLTKMAGRLALLEET